MNANACAKSGAKCNIKGQITIFMILGILLVVVFGSTYFIIAKVTESRQKATLSASLKEIFETSSVQQYVEICFSSSLRQALKTLGAQGGILYSSQQGYVDCRTIQGRYAFPACPAEALGANVTYRIGTYSSDKIVPAMTSYNENANSLYPCISATRFSTNPDNPCSYPFNENPNLGKKDNLPRLCKNLTQDVASDFCTVTNTTVDNYYAVQAQLEYYIVNLTLSCLDFRSFSGALGYNISVGNVSVDLHIGERNVEAHGNLPLTVNVKGGATTLHSVSFTASEPIRLKEIFRLMTNIVQEETKIFSFNVANPSSYPISVRIPAGMQIFLLRNVAGSAGADDLVIINDTLSSLAGGPYTMQFLIKDRPPALELYRPTISNPNYDLIVPVKSTIELKPLARDADDEQITYSYKGWKAEYDENISKGQTKARGNQVPLATNKWEDSSLYKNPYKGACIDALTGNTDARRCASYESANYDVGPHNVTVVAKSGTYFDWQVIRLLIEGLPEAFAISRNPYTDISPNFASLEDPYLLNGSMSKGVTSILSVFKWVDRLIPSDFTFEVGSSEIWLPTAANDFRNLDIKTIKSAGTPKFSNIGQRKIELTVKNAQDSVSDPFLIDVDVKQCLPHRSASAPFPFNEVPGDAYLPDAQDFYGNHTCCDNTYNIKGSTSECYQFQETTCRTLQWDYLTASLPNNIPDTKHYFGSQGKYRNVWDTAPAQLAKPLVVDFSSDFNLWPRNLNKPNSILPNPIKQYFDGTITAGFTTSVGASAIIDAQSQNDVFNRKFFTKCKGDRGNVCGGDVIEQFNRSAKCNQFQYCRYGNDRCLNWQYSYNPVSAYLADKSISSLKCIANVWQHGYSASGSQYLVRPVVSGDGISADGAAASSSSAGYGNNLLEPSQNGILDISTTYFIGVDCNYYDHYGYQSGADGDSSTSDAGNPNPANLPGIRQSGRKCLITGLSGSAQPQPTGTLFSPCIGCKGIDYSCSGQSCDNLNPKELDTACSYPNQCPEGSASWCNDCMGNKCNGATCFISSGVSGALGGYPNPNNPLTGTPQCCGDDSGENYAECNSAQDTSPASGCPAANKRRCCPSTTYCVDDAGTCKIPGQNHMFSAHISYCKNIGTVSVWKDIDQELSRCNGPSVLGSSNTMSILLPVTSIQGLTPCCGDDLPYADTWASGIDNQDSCCGASRLGDDRLCVQNSRFVFDGQMCSNEIYATHDSSVNKRSQASPLPSAFTDNSWKCGGCTEHGEACILPPNSVGICAKTSSSASSSINCVTGTSSINRNYIGFSPGDSGSSSDTFFQGCLSGSNNKACDRVVYDQGVGGVPLSGNTMFKADGYCWNNACLSCTSAEDDSSCFGRRDQNCNGLNGCDDATVNGCAGNKKMWCNPALEGTAKCRPDAFTARAFCIQTPSSQNCILESGGTRSEVSSSSTATQPGTGMKKKCENGQWIDPDRDQPTCSLVGSAWIAQANKCCGDDGIFDTFAAPAGSQGCCGGNLISEGSFCPSNNQWLASGNYCSGAGGSIAVLNAKNLNAAGGPLTYSSSILSCTFCSGSNEGKLCLANMNPTSSNAHVGICISGSCIRPTSGVLADRDKKANESGTNSRYSLSCFGFTNKKCISVWSNVPNSAAAETIIPPVNPGDASNRICNNIGSCVLCTSTDTIGDGVDNNCNGIIDG